MLYTERTIQVYAYHTHLLAIPVQIVDCLACCLCSRTHEDYYAVGFFVSIIREEVIFASCNFAYFTKIVFHHFRNLVISHVACFTMSEECLRILCCTTCHRTFRRKGAVAEAFYFSRVYKLCNLILIDDFNLLVFVRCTESVKEVDERNIGLECCQMRNGRQIHNLLYGTGAEHGKSCLTTSHHVLMVTEDT